MACSGLKKAFVLGLKRPGISGLPARLLQQTSVAALNRHASTDSSAENDGNLSWKCVYKRIKQIVGSGHEKWSFVLIEFSHFFLDIRPLYLDAQSTTPLDPRVLDAMLPYMTSFYGKFSLQLYSVLRTLYVLEHNK